MKILPVIVLYKRALADSVTYQSLLKDFPGTVFVYDNSPEAHPVARPDTVYIHDPENPGISKAYNTAADHARKNGFDFLLFLDQDTCFPADSLRIYADAAKRNPQINLFAPELTVNGIPFSPALYIRKRPRKIVLERGKIYCLPRYSPVNSGILIRTGTFWAAGGYNEKVKLDLSDFVFMESLAEVSPEFFLLDLQVRQSYGESVPSLDSEIIRFRFYLDSLKNAPRRKRLDGFWYFRMSLRRTLSGTFRRKTFRFIQEWVRSQFK